MSSAPISNCRDRRLTVGAVGLMLLAATSSPASDPPLGEWRVTELAGSITTINGGPAPPAGLCTQGEETVNAVRNDDMTFVELGSIPDGLFRDFEFALESRHEETSAPPIPSPFPEVEAPTHLFTFSFAFENGYHSNEALAAAGAFVSAFPEGRREMVAEILFGELTDALPLPGRQRSYYAGAAGWSAEDSTGSVVAGSVQSQESFGSGLSRFLVLGNFNGPRELNGTWSFFEKADAFGCTKISRGEGTWAAEPMR